MTTAKYGMEYQHIQDRDFEIMCFMLDVAIETILKRYQYNNGQLVMSSGMQELLKRAGQIVLILKGRGKEIKEGNFPEPTEEHYNI